MSKYRFEAKQGSRDSLVEWPSLFLKCWHQELLVRWERLEKVQLLHPCTLQWDAAGFVCPTAGLQVWHEDPWDHTCYDPSNFSAPYSCAMPKDNVCKDFYNFSILAGKRMDVKWKGLVLMWHMVREKPQLPGGGWRLPMRASQGASWDFRMVTGSQRGAGITMQGWRKVERSLWDHEIKCPFRLLDKREECCFRHKAELTA